MFFPSLPVSIPSKRVGSVSSIFQILHIAMYDTEKWNISCHISKQRMSSVFAALQHELVNPKETQERKNTCRVAAIRLKPLPIVSLEESQDVTRQGLAPDTWGAYQENDFSEPRLLHHPTYRKALNSLTWGIWFSIINSNILTFRLPALCCKTPIYYGSPLRLLRAILLGLPEMLPPRLEVLKIPT